MLPLSLINRKVSNLHVPEATLSPADLGDSWWPQP